MQANSEPMTPAPTIRRLLGISVSSRASVDDRMFLPSKGNMGICAGRDPVAIMIASAPVLTVLPSFVLTSISPGEVRTPRY
jgi:hypothetical protein